MGESFADEIDSGNFFDHIDDLIDFSAEDLDDGAITTNATAFPPIWFTHSDSLSAAADPGFSTNIHDYGLPDEKLSASYYEDMVQLKWLSILVPDSLSGAEALMINTSSLSQSNQFHVSSPVSVLDSSSSCEEKALATAAGRRGRSRSKRPRPPSFIPRPPQLISPTNSGGMVSSDSENYAEPCSPPPAEKTKKIKLSFRQDQNGAFNSQGVRKCLHCEVTKTPQWRAGPLGPKTLCNACGVRYKSGRLCPEYRPAASPTFVPCLHSNSHKKVLQMRIKQVEKGADESLLPELIPNTNSCIGLCYV